MGSSFVHLHNHTEYSMLDGAAKIKPLFTEAQRLRMPAIGMTDHGNMFGASEFYTAATNTDINTTGIKPIIGIEAYIAPGSRLDTRRVTWGDPGQKSDDVSASGAYLHMTMVAENATGLRNLFTLSSLASFEGQLGKWPRMDAEIIAAHAEGIIATTGCPSGEVQTRLRLGHDREALEAAARWREIFGADNYFLELMDHGLSIERRVRDGLLEIGRKLGIPPLATNDCHYVTREAAASHEALLCVQTGKTLSDPNRFKFDGDGYYLKSAAEMRALWDDEVPGACDSTLLIAERVQSYAEVWTPRDRMPVFPVPAGHTQASWLRHEVDAGLARRFPGGPHHAEQAFSWGLFLRFEEARALALLHVGFSRFLAVGLVEHDVRLGVLIVGLALARELRHGAAHHRCRHCHGVVGRDAHGIGIRKVRKLGTKEDKLPAAFFDAVQCGFHAFFRHLAGGVLLPVRHDHDHSLVGIVGFGHRDDAGDRVEQGRHAARARLLVGDVLPVLRRHGAAQHVELQPVLGIEHSQRDRRHDVAGIRCNAAGIGVHRTQRLGPDARHRARAVEQNIGMNFRLGHAESSGAGPPSPRQDMGGRSRRARARHAKAVEKNVAPVPEVRKVRTVPVHNRPVFGPFSVCIRTFFRIVQAAERPPPCPQANCGAIFRFRTQPIFSIASRIVPL